HEPTLAPVRQELESVQKQKVEFTKTIPTTLVSMTGTPRMVRVLPRGNWLDDSGEVVLPDVPAALPGARRSADPARATRLDLAREPGMTSPRPLSLGSGTPGPLPPRRRGGARQCPRRQRIARTSRRRAQRQAVSAGRITVVPELPQARVGERQGRQTVSPWAV